MSALQTEIKNAAVGVDIVDTSDGFTIIRKPACAAAIWHRQPMPGFQAWIDALDPAHLPSARVVLRPDAVPEAVRHLCDIAGMAEGEERLWLEADIAGLATRFATLMHAPYLRLRLDRVSTNACSKFHIDAVMARLICTYRGAGTQYGTSIDGAPPKRVFRVATGAPMILRGTLWPEAPAAGLLHRSPPIAGTGETRLVLVLDPVFDAEDTA
ncbi:hypothetical protein TG4357_02868 [Thalassovita gelatinovora]|uniref:DUF1826 domain-containing protein n=1 Tax=Thalassovita gelatinovora TaxID=53501 RepID=A0A0P1G0Q4_THAGE|nr:DUF1826 domain-containing protein [Thalassovita gelatinovora]QIZ81870.1 DUF1826 domain-containing protein [Thalassovita gelatinovora]CUH67197.1 hypothetical protein TG4357_02868 [Thalassovita gelatinovora]SEP78722.1 Protein of unknown function [Thalassovita gelatinovora]